MKQCGTVPVPVLNPDLPELPRQRCGHEPWSRLRPTFAANLQDGSRGLGAAIQLRGRK